MNLLYVCLAFRIALPDVTSALLSEHFLISHMARVVNFYIYILFSLKSLACIVIIQVYSQYSENQIEVILNI